MNKSEYIFEASGGHKTSGDVANAIDTIEDAIKNGIAKTVFRDLVTGLKILTSAMKQSKEEVAFKTIIQWLELYLRVENALNPEDPKQRKQFENYIPHTVSYIAIALYFKPITIEKYHFHLLALTLAILEVVTEETLEKVANVKPGLIACLWNPINFVGDFNTQLLGLRLTVKLLKCLSEKKQEEILEKICSSQQQQILKENICRAVEVANFQAGKFENAARELLNNFNTKISDNILVYSLHCREVKFGDNASFYKQLHAEHLWADLNYCTESISFDARYKADSKEKFIDVGVCIKIHKLELNNQILTVISNAEPQFSKTISNLNNLSSVRNIDFVLPEDEVRRLQENEMVLNYYNNKKSCSNEDKTDESREGVSNVSSDNNTNNIATIPTREKSAIQNTSVNQPIIIVSEMEPSTSQAAGHFGGILPIPNSNSEHSEERPESEKRLIASNISHDSDSANSPSTFKIPSLTYYENALIKSGLVQQEHHEDLSSSSNAEDDSSVITQRNIAETVSISETPKTSRSVVVQKRLLLNTAIPTATKSIKNNKTAKPRKTTKPSEKSCRTRKIKAQTSPLQRKKANKFQPMTHLAKSNGEPREASEELIQNDNIITESNVVPHSTESSAVLNDDEQRNIIENVNQANQNAKRFFRYNVRNLPPQTMDNTMDDTFDIFNESYADPGHSYRNFKLLKPVRNKPQMENIKLKKKASSIRNRKKTTANNKTKAKCNRGQDNDEEPTTSKEAKRIQPKRRKGAVTRSAIKEMASGVDAIPSNAIAFNSASDANATANSKKRLRSSSTDLNQASLQKKVKRCSKRKIIPKSNNEDIIDLISSEDELRNSDELVMSSQSLNKITESIISSTREILSHDLENTMHQNKEATSSHNIASAYDFNSVDNESEFELHSHTMTTIMNILERRESLNGTSNEPHSSSKDARCIPSSSKDRSGKLFELNDIQEIRKSVVPTEQVSSHVEIIIMPTDTLNVSNINEQEELTRECTQREELNARSPNINNTLVDNPNVGLNDGVFNSDCLLHRCRSDDEISVESNRDASPAPIFSDISHRTPSNISVRSIATKSTRRDSVSVLDPFIQTCQVTTTSVTMHEVISNDIFLLPSTSNCSQNIVPMQKRLATPETNNSTMLVDFERNDVSKYINSYIETNKELEVLQNPLSGDISDILKKCKRAIDREFEQLARSNTMKNERLDLYFSKVTEVSKDLLNKAEEQRRELEASEKEIRNLYQQLVSHCEAYQKKTEDFNCFKEDIELFLKSVTDINFEADIRKKFQNSMAIFQMASNKIRSKLWQEYVKDTSNNFVKNLSELSEL